MTRRIDRYPLSKGNPAARAVATGERADKSSREAQCGMYQQSLARAIAYRVTPDLLVQVIVWAVRT
jgi:hypothetical protein